jgi:hypothetical protein
MRGILNMLINSNILCMSLFISRVSLSLPQLLRRDLRGQVRQAITGAGYNDPLSQVSDREIKSPFKLSQVKPNQRLLLDFTVVVTNRLIFIRPA